MTNQVKKTIEQRDILNQNMSKVVLGRPLIEELTAPAETAAHLVAVGFAVYGSRLSEDGTLWGGRHKIRTHDC